MPPRALTEETQRKLIEGEKLGLSQRACAGRAGIALRTYEKWLTRGRRAIEDMEDGAELTKTEAPYAGLVRFVEEARAEWEASVLESLDDDENKRWQKDAWKLERKRPEEYALVTVNRNEGGPQQVTVNVLQNPEALDKLDSALRELARPKELESG